MSDICEVWKYWPLKDDFCLISHFVVGGPKNFKLLADISFESSFQNTVLPSLLLFSCACYYVDLDNIQWNEVATSTARNLNNSWPLHLTFSSMISFCPNIWFINNSKYQQYFFEKGASRKTQNFHIFKGPLFRNGWPYWYDVSWKISFPCKTN